MLPGAYLDKTHVTEVYQLLAHLLGVVPQVHNGSSSFLQAVTRQWGLVEPIEEQIPKPVHAQLLASSASASSSSGSPSSQPLSTVPQICYLLPAVAYLVTGWAEPIASLVLFLRKLVPTRTSNYVRI